MKTVLLKGEPRTDLGKSATKAVRAEGKVPCVLYGKKGAENTHFAIYKILTMIYNTNNHNTKYS